LKIILSKEQIELLKYIKAPYESDKDYDDDAMILLLDSITDYVLEKEAPHDEVTAFGEKLLDLHNYIVDKFDS